MIELDKLNPNSSTLSDYFAAKAKAFFNENGSRNMKFFADIKCYNCGDAGFISEFYDACNFRHVRCRGCGMIYVTPRLKKDIVHKLYSEEDYAQTYKLKLIPSLDYRKNFVARNKFNQVRAISGKDRGKVLDVGCGLGEVLSVFKENGWDVLGIEFNQFAADYARTNFGVSIINKSIYDFADKDKFDVIMLWGVLEHLYDPLGILSKCHKLLKKDGLLALEVPSADSFLVRYVEATGKKVDRIVGDAHLMLFSVLSFKEMLGKGGFICKKVQSNGLDIQTVNRLFFKKALQEGPISITQEALDDSLQGDLLRGFFSKEA